MKKIQQLALTLTVMFFTFGASLQHAEALPFVKMGGKLGMGSGYYTGDTYGGELSTNLFAGGFAATFDIMLLQLEANLLYLRSTTESPVGKSEANFFSVPVIGRIDLSPVPMFKLAAGLGYERRFYLGEGEAPELNYVPLSVRSDLSIPLVGSVGLEGRFNYQLGDAENKMHEFMLYIHAFL